MTNSEKILMKSPGISINLHPEGNSEYMLLMADRMVHGELDESCFQKRMSQYAADHPELINVSWADKDYIIRFEVIQGTPAFEKLYGRNYEKALAGSALWQENIQPEDHRRIVEETE